MNQFSKFGFALIAILFFGIATMHAQNAEPRSLTNRPNLRLKIKLLTGWAEHTTTNGPATFYRQQSNNPLQVSWAEYRGKKPLEEVSSEKLKETATTFGQKNGFGKLVESSGGKCVFGKCGTAIFRSEKHARIQVWFITDGTDYILATHICSTEPDPTEVGEVKEIVSMLTLGPEKPSTSAN
ncbi:MAG: hypothetical protein U1F83_18115 [Verrucomicrobiota bacterium]